MLRWLAIVFLFGLDALPVDAVWLKGRVVKDTLEGDGLANFAITDAAHTANQQVSSNDGGFTLTFPRKNAGDSVQIVVSRQGYVIVNREALNARIPSTVSVDEVTTIVVCEQKDLRERRLEYDATITGLMSQNISETKDQILAGADPSQTDFVGDIKRQGRRHGLSAAEIENWIAEPGDSPKQALTEFYRKDFKSAEQSSNQSAEDKIHNLERLKRDEEETRQREKELTNEIVDYFRRAGDASFYDYRFADALESYEKALSYAKGETDPQLWAGTLIDIGIAHHALGIRREGMSANEHLSQAVDAFRGSLNVYMHKEPKQRARAENNLGIALYEQGLRSEDTKVRDLLAQAVSAYRSALKVFTRKDWPKEWASIQNNLGLALYEQGRREEGTKAVGLLGEAVEACHNAQEVFTRKDWPSDWAMTQNNLGNVLSEQGLRGKGAEGTKLLAEAVVVFKDALEVYTPEDWPQDWAMTQNSLASALCDQSVRSEGDTAMKLLAEAASACNRATTIYTPEEAQQWAAVQDTWGRVLTEQGRRTEGTKGSDLLKQAVAKLTSALEIRTREVLPQNWAMTKKNLGFAIREQALRSEGASATELLAKAVEAFRSALEVYTREVFPADHEEVQANLEKAEALLRQTEAS